MFLIIVGTGAMGQTVRECAEEDETFDRIEFVEPLRNDWPKEKADLIIDFSHPRAVKGIYEYCLRHKGGIPIVMGTTGHTAEEEQLIKMLEKICPITRKSNFSKGIEILNELSAEAKEKLPTADIRIEEVHHTKKKDSPSGTANTLGELLGIDKEDISAIRMGNVFGIHKVYFALKDEVVEITHTAYSKRIFAEGAIASGKEMLQRINNSIFDL